MDELNIEVPFDQLTNLNQYYKKGYIINSISKKDDKVVLHLILGDSIESSNNNEISKWIDYFQNILILQMNQTSFRIVVQKKISLLQLLTKHYIELQYAFILTPREIFVPSELYIQSYDNNPLAIAHGQTISQPSLVADMIANMKLNEWDNSKYIRVYEIGTCTGYSTMWTCRTLSELGIPYTMDSIEYVPELIELAKKNLDTLPREFSKVDNSIDILTGETISKTYYFTDKRNLNSQLRIYAGDGIVDYGKKFDRIICTAGAHNIPIPFLTQLNIDGIAITSTKSNVDDGKAYGEKMLHITRLDLAQSNSFVLHNEPSFHEFIQCIVQDKDFNGVKVEMNGHFTFLDMIFHYHATCCMRFVPLIGSN